MRACSAAAPFIAVIDDDCRSARLLGKTLTAQGANSVRYLGCDEIGGGRLRQILHASFAWPDLVVLDLKATSQANLDFLKRHRDALETRGIPLVVMSRPLDRPERTALFHAGASGVFFRQAECDAYRRETASLLEFRARQTRQDTVGM